MDQVRDHLKDYLYRSCRVVSGKQTTIDQNLYLLIIQCFEVGKIDDMIGNCGLGGVCEHWFPKSKNFMLGEGWGRLFTK